MKKITLISDVINSSLFFVLKELSCVFDYICIYNKQLEVKPGNKRLS